MALRKPPFFKSTLAIFSILSCFQTECFSTTLTVNVQGDGNVASGGTFSGSEGDLRGVLNYINSATPDIYTVVFTLPPGNETIKLNDSLPVLNLSTSNTLKIDGSNRGGSGKVVTVSGANAYPGFIARQGNVSLENLVIANTLAEGRSGTLGKGANAGIGGGLLVDQAHVSLSNVAFDTNKAVGGGIDRTAGNNQTDKKTGKTGSFGEGGEGVFKGIQGGDGGFGSGGGGGGGGALPGKGGPGGVDGTLTAFPVSGVGRGGAGAGLGGAIFVNEGGTLKINGPVTITDPEAIGGTDSNRFAPGAGAGSALFSVSGTKGTNISFETAHKTDVITLHGEIGDDSSRTLKAGNTYQPGTGAGLSISKEGPGTLRLTSPHTYGGGTSVQGGTLELKNRGALPESSPLSIASEAQFDIRQIAVGSTQVGDLRGNGSIVLGSKNLILDTQSPHVTFCGTIQEGENQHPVSGKITKIGPGTLCLTGANTYSGGTTVSAGILEGDSKGIQGDIRNNSVVSFVQNENGSYSGRMSGDGALLKTGDGLLNLTGTNTYSGGTKLLNGTLQGKAESLQGQISNLSTLVFMDENAGAFKGEIAGTGSLEMAGTGNLGISTKNSYSGGTTISQGTLSLKGEGSLHRVGAVGISSSGNFDISEISAHSTQLGDLTGEGKVLLGNKNLTLGTSNSEVTFNGSLQDSGSLTKVGSGIVILTGENSYSGGTTVEEGTLKGTGVSLQGTIQNNAAIAFIDKDLGTYSGVISGTGALTMEGSGTLHLNNPQNYTGQTTVSSGTLSLIGKGSLPAENSVFIDAEGTFSIGALDNASTKIGDLTGNGTISLEEKTLIVGTTTPSVRFDGTIVGRKGGLTKEGSGTLVLSGKGTYSGETTVGNGTLALSSGGSLNREAPLSILSPGTFDVSTISNATEIGDLSGNGKIHLGAKSLTIHPSSSTVTFEGVIAGEGGSITKTGEGTLVLTGTNLYSGGTRVDGGSLAGTTTSLQGTISNNSKVVFRDQGMGTYSGVISGTGSLDMEGIGTVQISEKQSYSGGTSIKNGSLALLKEASLNPSAPVFIDSPANFDISGLTVNSTEIGDLSGNGTVSLGERNLTLGTSTPSVSFDGIIKNKGSLSKVGSGTLILTGANTYSGGTFVEEGVLQGSSQSLQGDIANNSSVVFNQTSNGTYKGLMSGKGSLSLEGGSTLNLIAPQSYTGGTTISDGTLALVKKGSLDGSDALFIGSSGKLDIHEISNASTTIGDLYGQGTLELGNKNLTLGTSTPQVIFDGVILDQRQGGSLSKVGTGIFVLTKGQDYIGGTTIAEGTLALTKEGSLNKIGNVSINKLANFDISDLAADVTQISNLTGTGTINLGTKNLTLGSATEQVVFEGMIQDGGKGGSLTKIGAGTLILNGESSFSGGTTIKAGELEGTTRSLQGNIMNDSSVVFTDAVAGTYQGIISGAGSLTLNGKGTLSITDQQIYTGGTTIAQGTLALKKNGSLPVSGDLRIESSGQFDLSELAALSTTLGDLSGKGILSLGSKNLTLGSSSPMITFEGVIKDDGLGGSLTKEGDGTLILTGLNAYKGGTTVKAGVLKGTAGSLQGDIVNLATLSFIDKEAGVYEGAISGAGTLMMEGSGSLTFSGKHSYSGGTILSQGTLALSKEGSLHPEGGIFIASGATFDIGALSDDSLQIGDLTGQGMVSLGSKNLTLGTSNAEVVFDGVMTDNGSFKKIGEGTLVLTNSQTYTGGTSVTNGTLSLKNKGSLHSTGPLVIETEGTFDIASIEQSTQIGDLTGNGNVFLGSKHLILGASLETVTFEGVISDGGQGGRVTKTGPGKVILAGENRYKGGTKVNGGSLQGTTKSLQGDIVNQAAVIFTDSESSTYKGSMTGTGSLSMNGSGTLSLTNKNSYSGGTFLNNGTVKIATDSSLGQGTLFFNEGSLELAESLKLELPLHLMGTGTILSDLGTTSLIAGNIQGNGSLKISGPGRINFLGNNVNYQGALFLNGGILGIKEPEHLGTHALAFNGGALELMGSDLLQNTMLELTGSGTLITDPNTYNQVNVPITGSGDLSILGTGILSLSANNTYTGNTLVKGGTLLVDGSLINSSTLSVEAKALLGGNGSLGNLDLYGTLSPGHSIGTLTANQVTFQKGSNYFVEIDGVVSDLLVAEGTVTIDPEATITISPYNATKTSYSILHSSLGVVGSFGSLVNPSARLQFTLDYTPNDLFLNFAGPVPFADLLVSGNDHALALCFDELLLSPTASTDLLLSVLDTLSVDELSAAFNQFDPSLFNAINFSEQTLAESIRQIFTNHLLLRGPCSSSCYPFRTWSAFFQETSRQGGEAETSAFSGYRNNFSGVIFGVDFAPLEELTFTSGFTYAYARHHWLNANGKANFNSYTGTVAALFEKELFRVDVYFGYSFNQVHAYRDVFVASPLLGVLPISERIRHSGGASAYTSHLGFSYDLLTFNQQNCEIVAYPFIDFDYIALDQNPYSEFGGEALDLDIHRKRSDYLRSEIGLGWSLVKESCLFTTSTEIALSYARESRFEGKRTRGSFAGNSCVFDVYGLFPSNNLFCPSIDIGICSPCNSYSLSLNFQGAYGNHYRKTEGSFEVRIQF